MKRVLPWLLSIASFTAFDFSLLAGSSVISGSPAFAQAGNICYMVSPSGEKINLNGLCGTSQPAPKTQSSFSPRGVHRAKIKRREGGTPIIDVTFNGNKTFEMLVDTGASSTVVTPRMAKALAVMPLGLANVMTPSDKNAKMVVAAVESIEVSGAKVRDLQVLVAEALDIGLLGQNFFKGYDVVIKRDFIEFYPHK